MATPVTPAPAVAGSAAAPKRLEERAQEFFRSGWRRIDLRLVNASLLTLIAGLFIYLVSQVVSGTSTLAAMSKKDYSLAGLVQSATGFKDIASVRGVGYYLEKVGKRNIFKRGARLEDEKKADELSPSSKALELVKALRLVGISWSEDPDAMIEDTRAAKTFFIKKGQSVGEFKVENILKDRIVLRYNKELVELK